MRPCCWLIAARHNHLVALQKLLKRLPIAISCAAHFQIFQQPKIADLVTESLLVDGESSLAFVGFHATNVRGTTARQGLNEFLQRSTKLGTRTFRTFGILRGSVLHQEFDEGVSARFNEFPLVREYCWTQWSENKKTQLSFLSRKLPVSVFFSMNPCTS